MLDRLKSIFVAESPMAMYAHLPEEIQSEIRDAMDATTPYDIP